MKKFLYFFLLLPAFSFSQVFNSPESVEYDAANNRWLAGQNGSGVVLGYSPSNGVLTNFCSGLTTGPHGIEILGSTLYCCDGGLIRGFDLTTGSQVFNLSLGATFLNGLTSDGNNFLFATDFSTKKIYRVNVSSSSYNVMVTTTKTPNGIIYDGAHNRLVFVTWGASAPIQAMSLADSTVSTLRATSLSNCDGIMRDQQGRWYATSWGTNALNRFDSAFANAPTALMTGLSSPADLGINLAGDSIGIPNSGAANNVVFYVIPAPLGIENNLQPDRTNIFPNPSREKTTIVLNEPVINGTIELMDDQGKMIVTQKANGLVFFLERGLLSSGIYFVIIKDKEGKIISTKKLIYS